MRAEKTRKYIEDHAEYMPHQGTVFEELEELERKAGSYDKITNKIKDSIQILEKREPKSFMDRVNTDSVLALLDSLLIEGDV